MPLNLPLQVPVFARLDEYVGAWLIEPMRAASLMEWARRTDLAQHVTQASGDRRPSSIEKIVSGDKTIALIRATGLLMKQEASVGNSTSTIQLRRDIRAAVADTSVNGILLAFDSPGGTAAGTEALAAEIAAARQAKPVWAQAEDLMASAAYFAGSQADRIYASNKSTQVGSIGTVMGMYDVSGAAEQQGVKALVFATGDLKGAGFPGTQVTEQQKAYFQGIVDGIQRTFDSAVKQGRRMNDAQLSDVRTGAVWAAPEAEALNLIDGIQSLDQTVKAFSEFLTRRVSGGASQGVKAMQTFEQFLAARGINASQYTEAHLATLRADFDRQQAATALPTAAPLNTDGGSLMGDVERGIQLQRAEAQRIADVTRICRQYGNPTSNPTGQAGQNVAIESHAIAQGWDVQRAELECLRNTRAPSSVGLGAMQPHIHVAHLNSPSGAAGVDSAQVLECGIAQAMGGNRREAFSEQVNDAAHRQFKGRLGLKEVLLRAAIANGYPEKQTYNVHMGNLKGLLRYAFPVEDGPGIAPRQEGFSTIALSGILGNVANKEINAGYMEEDNAWRNVAKIKSVNNFYLVTSYRMLDSMTYELLPPGGEIKHGNVSQESYTRQAKTYAKMFALTREDFVNDDLQAFSDIRERIGRGAAKKLSNVFWTAFTNNGSFFTSGNTNYFTGATTTLLVDGVGLGLGVKAFRKMTSPSADDTKRVGQGMRPKILLVPPELEQAADMLFANDNLATTSAVLNGNIYKNKYRPVVAWQLSDSNYTGYSTTAWYLLSDPAESGLAPVAVSFLNGQESPTVESAEADFDHLGVQFRGYHDFGCDQADYLAGVKSKGAA